MSRRGFVLLLVALLAGLETSCVYAQQGSTEPPAGETSPDRLELPAGGLIFVPDDRLAVESEQVVLARGKTQVDYTVRNRAEDRLVRIVAWPLPEIDMNVVGDGKVELPSTDLLNFALAHVVVDGARIPLMFEQRASVFARDLTGELQSYGLPLHPMAPGLAKLLRALSPERLASLEERGAIVREEDRLLPNWTVRTTAFWRQIFAPDKAIQIRLSYEPIVGVGEWRSDLSEEWRQTYCIDKDLEAAIAARRAKSGGRLGVHRMTYSVAQEPGWWAPVPSFRLAIEKSRFGTLIAACLPGLHPAGPTLLEVTRRDFKPADDIRILFID